MKIDSTYTPAAANVATKPAQPHAAPSPATDEAVSLSPLAGNLINKEAPPINAARIQEIKQAISEGKFTINPEAIADRLLESARDLINSSPREA